MSKSYQHGHKHTWQIQFRHKKRPSLEESSLFTSPILEARGRDVKGGGKWLCTTMLLPLQTWWHQPAYPKTQWKGWEKWTLSRKASPSGLSLPPSLPHKSVSPAVRAAPWPAHLAPTWLKHWSENLPPMLLIHRAPVPSLQKSELVSSSRKQGSPAVSSHSKGV